MIGTLKITKISGQGKGRQSEHSMWQYSLKEGVTIVTELFVNSKVDLTLWGGKVFSLSRVTVSIPVFQMIQSVYPDWVIGGSE